MLHAYFKHKINDKNAYDFAFSSLLHRCDLLFATLDVTEMSAEREKQYDKCYR